MKIKRLFKRIFEIREILILVSVFLILFFLIERLAGIFFIFGGEGNYFLDFSFVRDVYQYAWHPIAAGSGFPNPILNFSFGIFHLFSLLQGLGLSLKFINSFSITLVYFLPFVSMYWLLVKIIGLEKKIGFLISLFYLLNPFSLYHLKDAMFWNTAPMFVFPIVFGIIHRYYSNSIKLFLFFGIITAIFSFSFSNIPYLGLFQIFLLMSVVIVSFLKSEISSMRTIVKNLLVLELSFFLFGAFWIINLVRFQIQDLNNYYTSDFAISWAKSAAGDGFIMSKIFSLTTLIPNDESYILSRIYNFIFSKIILLIPFFIVLISLFKNKQKNKKILLVLVFFLVSIFFLNKGVNEPFGFFYLWMLENIPFFIVFKSPLEKFSVLLIFLLTIIIAIILNDLKNKFIHKLVIFYILLNLIPLVSMNFIPDFNIKEGVVTRKFTYKQEYADVKNIINNKKKDFKILSVPGSRNYQVTLKNHDNKYYRGMDPLMYSFNKPFIAAYSEGKSDIIFNNFSSKNIEEQLAFFNVGAIVMNRDIVPSFGFKEKESKSTLDRIFKGNNTNEWSSDSVSLYYNDNFLPHFYIPEGVIIEKSESENKNIFFQSDYQTVPGIFFEEQNLKSIGLLRKMVEFEKNKQNLEFKKLNPTKYRIIIHNAHEKIPLIFSESFHAGWNIYSGKHEKQDLGLKFSSMYKILDGNEDDQASKEELEEFINNGLISSLGDGREKNIKHKKWEDNKEKLDYIEKYNIDFISKNFQGTIQNDNLPNGNFWETWLRKPIAEENHLMANGYANSWIIDAEKICSENPGSCYKNSDGTYDMELIVEFWPQRLFYIGAGISLSTFIGCLIYLGINRFGAYKKNKNNNE